MIEGPSREAIELVEVKDLRQPVASGIVTERMDAAASHPG